MVLGGMGSFKAIPVLCGRASVSCHKLVTQSPKIKKSNIGKVTSRRHISSEEWQGMNREQASSLWSWVR